MLSSSVHNENFSKSADTKFMRRIIAEDPEWNLATVPHLIELCLTHIVSNFAANPILEELPLRHKTKVLSNLSVDIPLIVSANLIADENYWERCCKTRWQVCDVSQHKNLWKRMYFEKNLCELIEKFVPGITDTNMIKETLNLSSNYVKCLNIKQLLPPVKGPTVNLDEDFSDNESENGDVPLCDHFDFNIAVEMLPYLKELHLTYGVKDCGMNFEWSLFEFTTKDCYLLAKAAKLCKTLETFHFHRSKIADDKARVLISHLIDHPTLNTLDLSYNKLENGSARAIGKLLNGHSHLVSLDLTNNQISVQGAAAIAHALAKNETLKSLSLRLNRLCDDGCQAICRALLQNTTLHEINLGSNDITHVSAPLIAQVFVYNKSLTNFILSCNTITEEGGKTLQEGMEDNMTLLKMDLRLTDIGQECEYSINQFLKKNRERHRKKEN